ncbi:ABC transporter [Eisenbergiella tayi]|uniref:ABC transporter n=2 Tax=Eisenbergiella tayi TaxID=1432052 RepID=A0ABX3APM3_9FIRM|nr:ABC transporter ATP-binding protein [Eisenbergiella tayi]ODR61668.1 ABC transporter [Eisenbergiella tayi]ODR62083.1 ABC transporter [Eisenbergiella tayi]RJW40327.1 ABC transporter ATP-binding protein [Lachnospiraceae bacterium TF09-5]
MDNAMVIENLSKAYPGFALSEVSMTLPRGSIMGFIGENGAGKTTTIKLILNMLHRDSGSVRILGKDNIKEEKAVKERLGVVLGDLNLPETMNGLKINSMMSGIYPGWEEDVFFSNLERFGLPKNRKIKAYSRGMKMKLSIAIALSHGAELLLLDEPTSGLDPIIRDEILDIFLDFIQDETHSIFVSTHIVEDLEKIADYITFIHKGRIILSEEKDTLLERFVILKGPKEGFAAFESSELIGYKEKRFGAEAMAEAKVWRKKEAGAAGLVADPVRIQDIMLYYVKGERI